MKDKCIMEDLYLVALENSFDEIFITNSEGVTIYCNPPFEKHYGFKTEEIIGNHHFLIDKNLLDISPVEITLTRKETVTVEQSTAEGRKLWITTTPVFDEQGNIKYIIGNSRDITEIQEMKNQIHTYQKQVDAYKREIEVLKTERANDKGFNFFSNESFKKIIKNVQKVASKDASVLILGESGTGKSYLAKYIHDQSQRASKRFITVNCSTLSENLIESELFGYAEGAFTGSKKGGKQGLIEMANGGTLFFDEIGELPIHVQAKFLEIIQNKSFTPVGSLEVKYVDVRIIAATNQCLTELIEKKRFRSDLYYRLKLIEFDLPPLRKRSEDLPGMIHYFLDQLNNKYKSNNYFSVKCMKKLIEYSWPGNIRELRNLIEQLIIFSESEEITELDLPHYILCTRNEDEISTNTIHENNDMSLKTRLELYEQEIICSTYKKYHTSTAVAKALNISQSQASRKIAKYVKNR